MISLTAKNNTTTFIVLIASCLIVLLGLAWHYDSSLINGDTVEHTSVALNLLSGNGFRTSIVYWDNQYLAGGMPTPQTVFAPGYPVLIAFMLIMGVPQQYAAVIVASISLLLSAFVLENLLRRQGCVASISVGIAIIWLFTLLNWQVALAGLTEPTFVLFTLLALQAVHIGLREQQKILWMFWAGVWVSAAFLIRYTGIFFIATIGAYLLVCIICNDFRKALFSFLAFSGIPTIVVLTVFTRNMFLTGDLTGGQFGKSDQTPVLEAIKHVYWALCEGFNLPDLPVHADEVIIVLIVLGMAIIAYTKFATLFAEHQSWRVYVLDAEYSVPIISFFYLFWVSVFIYYFSSKIAMFFASGRYFLPLLPFALILAFYLLDTSTFSLTPITKKIAVAVNVILCFLLLLGRIESHISNTGLLKPYGDVEIRSILNQHVNGITAIEFLRRQSPDTPVISNLPLRYFWLTNRPVIGFAPAQYSKTEWTVERVRQIAGQYKAKYVVFFPSFFFMDDIFNNSNQHFFFDLKNKRVPSFLHLIFISPKVEIYEIVL